MNGLVCRRAHSGYQGLRDYGVVRRTWVPELSEIARCLDFDDAYRLM